MRKDILICLTFLLVIAMICGTMLWINHNSWTVRFEMDDNTLQSIESVEYPINEYYQTGVSIPNE